MPSPEELLTADAFASRLGVTLISASEEQVEVAMTVGGQHLDRGGRLATGVVFSLADCAMSFISNSATRNLAVSVHLTRHAGAAPGDEIRARAVPTARNGTTTTWRIEVSGPGGLVGVFTGTTMAVPG